MHVKYMGSADVRLIESGEDFAGRLATPVDKTVQWDKDNHWVVDTDEVGLSPEAIALLVEEPDFQDVTGLERVPVNLVQSIFYGLKNEPQEVAVAEVTPNPVPNGGRITPPEEQEVTP